MAGEWPSHLDVWSLSQSLQSLAVAFGSSFLKGPPAPSVNIWWIHDFWSRGHRCRLVISSGRSRARVSPSWLLLFGEREDPFSAAGAGMFSEPDAFADSGTADEWLSFCDSVFPWVMRVEDVECIGIIVRTTQDGVEVALPFGAATSGMPDAIDVTLASESGSYRGTSRAFPAVNLVEPTGDSSDRLEPLEELPVELMEFDDSGRLPLPTHHLVISHARLSQEK